MQAKLIKLLAIGITPISPLIALTIQEIPRVLAALCQEQGERPNISMSVSVIVVQSLSCVQLFVTPWTAACQAFWSFTISWSLLKLMSIELVMPSNYLILCHPLLLLPSIFPSIRVFSNESALRIRWPKYWSLSFSISPSNEYSGLISFRIDWFDLLAVQGTLKSLLQYHSSKNHSFKKKKQNTIALTIQTSRYLSLSYDKSEYQDFSGCPGVRTQC